jgi:hypothetical protein
MGITQVLKLWFPSPYKPVHLPVLSHRISLSASPSFSTWLKPSASALVPPLIEANIIQFIVSLLVWMSCRD